MSNEIPLYQTMINDLVHKIENGQLKQDTKLPSESKLGDLYGVSRITVRRALAELVERGYIYKRHGSGSFIARRKMSDCNESMGMVNLKKAIQDLGAEPKISLQNFKLIVDGTEQVVRSKLGLDADDYLYGIEYQLFADDKLVGILRWYLPFEEFPNLYLSELEHQQFLALLASKYNCKPHFQVLRNSSLATRAEKKIFGEVSGNVIVNLRLLGSVHDKIIIYGEVILAGQVTMYLFKEDV